MYDFNKMTDRRGTVSYKWDIPEAELPMWVADMDFEAPRPVKRALISSAEHGIYGYSITPDAYFEAYRGYWSRRHGVEFKCEEMVYASGIVAALSSLVRKLTTPAENVLIQAPVFNLFFNSVVNNGRNILSSDLVYDGERYEIDFEDLERKLADPQTSLMILCNPHNPVGKIWSREELSRIGELCKKYSVTVLSDEIHCDFTRPGFEYTPFYLASETCRDISITLISGSKTFNIAGLQSACLVAHDPALRHKAWRAVNTDEIGEPNVFAVGANIAAFTECDEWVNQLREYTFENRDIAYNYINGRIKGLHAIWGDATYLLWIDISEVSRDSKTFVARLRELTGLYLSAGIGYGEPGRCFVRLNLATQRERLMDGLSRLEKGVALILEENN